MNTPARPDNLTERIRAMIVDRLFLDIDPADIDEKASLIDTYGVDSVSLLELVVGIEETFGIRMADEAFEPRHFESVQALSDFVRQHLPAE